MQLYHIAPGKQSQPAKSSSQVIPRFGIPMDRRAGHRLLSSQKPLFSGANPNVVDITLALLEFPGSANRFR
jgi:hypothetical protein